jgi:Ni,Fe-hydrogenase III large subunit
MSGSAAIGLNGEKAWRDAVRRLSAGEAALVSLWGDEGRMRMALREANGALAVVEVACDAGAFPSVAALHPPASRLERSACDLFGFTAIGAHDDRRWLDHGRWPLRHPLGRAEARDGAPDPYPFLKAEGSGLHQIPVGPVHAGIIEPGHFRFHAGGEAVVRLEERLGYVHKGVDSLMRGAGVERAAVLAARVSGDSTVAYGVAFARAVEAALGIEPPARAHSLRGVMAELERIANHLGDVGAICNDAAFALMHAHCGILRERTLRAAQAAFGHRLMMDAAVPGGVAVDLAPEGMKAILALVREIRKTFPKLVQLYDNTASLQDRTVGTGVLKAELARRYGAGGVVGRASGRDFDARRDHPYPPYDSLAFNIATRSAGDVNARVWVRIDEIGESLALIETMLARLPDGPVCAAPAAPGGPAEGFALVEAFRGDVFAHVRLAADGTVARCHLRDASWLQWPLLEAAIEGNIVADFPLCNKSFNCSYSGCDL